VDKEKDEKREERRRDRKSRWGAKDEEPEQGEQNREGGQVNGQGERDDAGLEAHDAPKTPPEEFDQNEATVPNVSNNEDLIATQDNLAQHIEIVENRAIDADEVHGDGDTHQSSENQDSFEQNQTKPDFSEPIHQDNQDVPEAAQEPTWSEPSNQESFGVSESESSNQPLHEQEHSTNQLPPFEAGEPSINQSESSSNQADVAQSEPTSNQPAYDLLGDLGAVSPSFNQPSSEGGQEGE